MKTVIINIKMKDGSTKDVLAYPATNKFYFYKSKNFGEWIIFDKDFGDARLLTFSSKAAKSYAEGFQKAYNIHPYSIEDLISAKSKNKNISDNLLLWIKLASQNIIEIYQSMQEIDAHYKFRTL